MNNDMDNIRKHYKKVTKALRRFKHPDPFFLTKYQFSPYMACQHACKYCDGRAEKYYVQGDYEKDIVIRSNLPELLKKELSGLREMGIIGIGSGISDPYQPLEKDELITGKALAILKDHNFPISIHTKSHFLLRDIDLIEKLQQKTGVIIFLSLTTLNDDTRRIFEPGAPTVNQRLKTIQELKKRGIPIGILAMPFLPFISDQRENISELFSKLSSMKIDFVLPWFLTLRPGKQKAVFLKVLYKFDPNLSAAYEELYSNKLPSGMPIQEYRKTFKTKIDKLLAEYDLISQVPHHLYKKIMLNYDQIFILLHHMMNLYPKSRISRLKKAAQKYFNWLNKEKEFYNRHRSRSFTELEHKLIYLLESGKMADIIENKRLTDLMKSITIDNLTFDYHTRTLN